MPQITLLGVKCTTITVDGTTAYPLPDWAPDIEAFATTTNVAGIIPDGYCASTSGLLGMGNNATATRFDRAGARCFLFSSGHRNSKKDIWSVVLRYQGVGELVRT